MVSKPGLRERKKLAAMRHIQETALDLFEKEGFEKVTIEQIAGIADCSPSSIYRYFGTKEQIVIWDETDVRFSEIFEVESGSYPPVEAVRRAIAQSMASFYEREEELAKRKTRCLLEEPALRVAWLEMADAFSGLVAETLAKASGLTATDLKVQVVASALVWSMVTATVHWHDAGYSIPLQEEFENALAVLESGLRLD